MKKVNDGKKQMSDKSKTGTSLHKFVAMGGKPSEYNKKNKKK